MTDRVRLECRTHGWQDTVVYTRHERRGHPSDVADRYVCQECARTASAATEENSLRIGPAEVTTRLRLALEDLARHLRRWHEPALAAAVEGALLGEAEELPRRALRLLTPVVGGLLDRPLCKADGLVDQGATNRRDRLAERVRSTADEALA